MIENPARANGHIFNVGNPNNEVTVRQLAEMMTEVNKCDNFVFVMAALRVSFLPCCFCIFSGLLEG
jgi:nucleoside-diphosphate-sugar epimerase